MKQALNMLTLESLEAAGYRKFTRVAGKSAAYGMQKLVEDTQGERYFITVFVYDHSALRGVVERFNTNPWSFAPEVQFKRGVEPTIDVHYLDNDVSTVEKMEDFYARMWEFLGRHYC